MTRIKIIAIVAAVLGQIFPQTTAAATAKGPRHLYYYYVNISGFHGNGEVVWLADDGFAIVQLAARNSNRLFKFIIPDSDLKWMHDSLATLKPSPLKGGDRQGIPGEVRVRLGHRAAGKLSSTLVWENDLPKLSTEIRLLHEIGRRLITIAEKQKPTTKMQFKPGQLKVDLPPEFISTDLATALK